MQLQVDTKAASGRRIRDVEKQKRCNAVAAREVQEERVPRADVLALACCGAKNTEARRAAGRAGTEACSYEDGQAARQPGSQAARHPGTQAARHARRLVIGSGWPAEEPGGWTCCFVTNAPA